MYAHHFHTQHDAACHHLIRITPPWRRFYPTHIHHPKNASPNAHNHVQFKANQESGAHGPFLNVLTDICRFVGKESKEEKSN